MTQPLRDNYGGILQCYALQILMKRMGHTPIVLNRDFNYPPFRLFIIRCLSAVKCIWRRYIRKNKNFRVASPTSVHYFIHVSDYYDNAELKNFIKTHINRSIPLRSSWLLKQYVRYRKFHCYIVGSDQVWRQTYSPCITDFFLTFLPKSTKKIKRIAYAASFGTEQCDIPANDLPKCKTALKLFDAISVREHSGISIVKSVFGLDALQVLDPTLLLSSADYHLLIDKKDRLEGLYIAYYVLDFNEDKQKIVSAVASMRNVQEKVALSIYPKNEDGSNARLVSMSRWLAVMANADFVVTDSFHGCVFSIIFRKPFVAIANSSRGTDRFYSLLNSLGLENRLVFSFDQFLQKKATLESGIDYNSVAERLEPYRKMSMDFLEKYLQ